MVKKSFKVFIKIIPPLGLFFCLIIENVNEQADMGSTYHYIVYIYLLSFFNEKYHTGKREKLCINKPKYHHKSVFFFILYPFKDIKI